MMKFLVVALAIIGLAFVIMTYANTLFTKIAFTAPGVGAVSYAACGITAVAVLFFAKLSWK